MKYYNKVASENRLKFTNLHLVSNTQNFKLIYNIINQIVTKLQIHSS